MMTDAPRRGAARFDILLAGSLGPAVVSTCSLIRDDDVRIVVDPGICARQSDILDPLRALDLGPDEVTDVVISHHHPDHTLNVALFPEARVHDHWAIYDFHGRWDSIDADGREIAPSVRLMRTPGHSNEDITTLAATADGVVAFTHAWWTSDVPVEDPYCPDPAQLRDSRARLLELADLIVPGHGAPFRPDVSTPR